jgi:AAA15 family ATPase/GTPase
MNTIVDKLKSTYDQLNRDTVHGDLLNQLYADDIVFTDPLHELKSLDSLKTYFQGMYKNVTAIHFDFDTTVENETDAFLTWVMTFQHPKLNSGKAVKVPGTTHIQHNGVKVTKHQDYFDSTHMIFDHIPVLRLAIGAIKQRMK